MRTRSSGLPPNDEWRPPGCGPAANSRGPAAGRRVADTGGVMEIVILAVVIALVVVGAISGLVVSGRKKKQLPPSHRRAAPTPSPRPPAEPQVGEDAETPRRRACRTIEEVATARPPGHRSAEAEDPAAAPGRARDRGARAHRRAGWSGCAPGSPGRRTPWARACSRCCPANTSTRTPGRRSRTPSSPPTSASPRPRNWSSGCATRVKVLGTRTPEDLRALLREELLALVGTDLDRTRAHRDATDGGDSPGRRDGRRRQRHRQDHHHRQARPGPGRRRPQPWCSAPPTPSAPPPPTSSRPGASGSGPAPCAARRAATRRRSPSTPSRRASPRAPTSSSSTPPAGCTPRPA